MQWHVLVEGTQNNTSLPGRLPVVSGMRMAKAVKKLGYSEVGQKGSHLRLRKILPNGSPCPVTIPMHKELSRGVLISILTDVSRANGISKQQLVNML
jgi:predicted RNA binding protein YcfA (HicA-like mRNA interferase family)